MTTPARSWVSRDDYFLVGHWVGMLALIQVGESVAPWEVTP